MCGIAGVVTFNSDMPLTADHLAAMSHKIAHRGPDDQRIWLSETAQPASFTQSAQSGLSQSSARIGMAFRRLAVIDPDPRAMQPMTTPDGRYTLVFNGEIYNFRQLRSELSGINWKTNGDAEVLLQVLARWGESGLEKLNGMFALALWDDAEKTLLLARDRMGQKPLYFSIGRSSIAFASELPALDAWPDWEQEIDPASLTDYLRYGTTQAPRTLYRGAHQILPGHWLKISRIEETLTQLPYFNPNDSSDSSTHSPQDFRRLIEQAVERQLVSDVPLGLFLSGGIDSSIIAACARRHGRVKTFSIGFDDPRYDETAFANEVAHHLDTDHHTFRVTPDAASDLPKLATVFGEPFGDSSALPTHYLSQQTRAHVTVALSGDGGDELFGGYERYRAISLPTGWLFPFAPLGRWIGGHPKSRRYKLARLLTAAGLNEGERYREYLSIFNSSQLQSLFPQSRDDSSFLRQWNDLRTTRSCVQTALAIDRVRYLPNDLLAKVDRASMLHALEVRNPFMDHDLIRAAAHLNQQQLFKGGKKRMLREAFSNDLPASVFHRPKMGFAVPIGQWFRSTLRAMLHDHLNAAGSFARQHFEMAVVQRLLHEHASEKFDHSQRLYALLMIELWHRAGAARGLF